MPILKYTDKFKYNQSVYQFQAWHERPHSKTKGYNNKIGKEKTHQIYMIQEVEWIYNWESKNIGNVIGTIGPEKSR
jgi:hypothetical protein